MAELLGDDWAWVRTTFSIIHPSRDLKNLTQIGVGRDDGVSAGEFNPIFYKKSVTITPLPPTRIVPFRAQDQETNIHSFLLPFVDLSSI